VREDRGHGHDSRPSASSHRIAWDSPKRSLGLRPRRTCAPSLVTCGGRVLGESGRVPPRRFSSSGPRLAIGSLSASSPLLRAYQGSVLPCDRQLVGGETTATSAPRDCRSLTRAVLTWIADGLAMPHHARTSHGLATMHARHM
jgi:hypothetical protein